MTNAARFVRYGMLPKELPPSFSSESLASAIGTGSIPTLQGSAPWCQVGSHSLPHPSGVRRALGLVNPLAYCALAEVLAANWTSLDAFLRRSRWSLTRPSLKPRIRRGCGPSATGEEVARARAASRATGRWLVRADIAEFYRSVYTHAITWALHGKANAKSILKQKGNKAQLAAAAGLWGDAIDRAQQVLQHGQTNGIPIGPDTSFVIGEIFLTAIDIAVRGRMPNVRAIRQYDDYEIVARTRADADEALTVLQDVLAELDLHVNARKTKILPLPDTTVPSLRWVREEFPSSLARDRTQALIDYFDRVFAHRSQFPESTVVSYALSRAAEMPCSTAHWGLLQDLMAHAAVTDTAATQQYVRAMLRFRVDRNMIPDPSRFASLLSEIIHHNAPRRHGNEVAWAVWAAMAFDVQLDAGCRQLIEGMDDDVVLLLALQANTRGRFKGKLNTAEWTKWLDADQLQGEHWLLAYEVVRSALLPLPGGVDYVTSHKDFDWMRQQKVTFLKRFRKPSPRVMKDIVPYSVVDYGGEDGDGDFEDDD